MLVNEVEHSVSGGGWGVRVTGMERVWVVVVMVVRIHQTHCLCLSLSVAIEMEGCHAYM